MAQAAAHIDPEHFNGLVGNLSQMQDADALSLSNKLREVSGMLVQKEAEFNRQKTLLETLKGMDRKPLEKALPVATSDNELKALEAELDLAQQSLIQLKSDYAHGHPKYQNAQAAVEDLQRKVHDRMDGIMLGLQMKLDSSASFVATLKARLEELQTTNQHGL
jgi:hypothetical protein